MTTLADCLNHEGFKGVTIFPSDRGLMVSIKTDKGLHVDYVEDPSQVTQNLLDRLDRHPDTRPKMVPDDLDGLA